jgi:hypothetical protein
MLKSPNLYKEMLLPAFLPVYWNRSQENQIGKIKNPTSQDESGVLFQINHVDSPLKFGIKERHRMF